MSFRQHAKRTRRSLAHAFFVNYGRHMPYSALVDRVNRLPLLDSFMRQNSGAPSFPSREAMWSHVIGQCPAAIDYLEFGVHRGHSIFYFAEHHSSPESRFFGFDTFTGLPEDWNPDFRRGHFDIGGSAPATADARIEFVVGLFQDTLPKFIANFKTDRKIVVNIDCDLYSSALYCLTRLDSVLPAGTILIFDEFGEVLHEFRAANDYISSYRRQFKVICSHDDFYTVAVELT